MLAICLRSKEGGIYQDALIFETTLKSYFQEINIIIPENSKSFTNCKYILRIFIEHINSTILLNTSSKYTLYVPNNEFVQEWDIDYLKYIDYVICKTNLTTLLFRNLTKTYYTKFTSLESNEDSVVEECSKDYNTFVHFAGRSPLKSTLDLIKTWKTNFSQNNTYRLIITRTQTAELPATDLIYWNSLKPEKISGLDGFEINGDKHMNIYLFDFLPVHIKNYYAQLAGFFICPSLIEGYGHYINEGRFYKSVVITTDSPPMNELISDERCLIKVKEKIESYKLIPKLIPGAKWLYKFSDLYASKIDTIDLTNKINDLCKLDINTLKEIGNDNYNNFKRDDHYFKNRMTNLIKSKFL